MLGWGRLGRAGPGKQELGRLRNGQSGRAGPSRADPHKTRTCGMGRAEPGRPDPARLYHERELMKLIS